MPHHCVRCNAIVKLLKDEIEKTHQNIQNGKEQHDRFYYLSTFKRKIVKIMEEYV